MKKSILTGLAAALIVAGVAVNLDARGSNEEIPLRNLNTIEVDGFDKEGFWQAKFSRFRSLNWDSTWGNIPSYRPVYSDTTREESTRTENDQWIRYIGDTEEYNVIPYGLIDSRPSQVGENAKVLGVRGNWDFPGYNWIMIEPKFTHSAGIYPDSEVVANGRTRCGDGEAAGARTDCAGLDYLKDDMEPPYPFMLHVDQYDPANQRPKLLPHYIQIPGKAEAIDFWAWGKGYRYELDIHVEDFHGNAHTISGPMLNFMGWRNVRVQVPTYIPQTQRYLPKAQGLRFVRFKVTATPEERPDDFYIYLDYMQVLTDLYVQPFFGDDLVNHPSWYPTGGGTTATATRPTGR